MITEKYLIETSADSISPELKTLINDFSAEIKSLSEDKWTDAWKKNGRLNVIILKIAKLNIYKALELSKISDVFEAITLASCLGGDSYPDGGRQAFELPWHIANDHLEILRDILKICNNEDDVAFTLDFIASAIKRKINVLTYGNKRMAEEYIDDISRIVSKHHGRGIHLLMKEMGILKNIISENNSSRLIKSYEEFIAKYQDNI